MKRDRLSILKLLNKIIDGALILLGMMKITSDYTDQDLVEIQNNIQKADTAINNSLHTYNQKGK